MLDELNPLSKIGQVSITGAGSRNYSYPSLKGNASGLFAVMNTPDSTLSQGYTANVTSNTTNMSILITVSATGAYQSGTPVFVFDIYARFT